MKRNRIMAVILVFVMTLCALTGCGLFKPTAVSLSKKTAENFAKVQSFKADVIVDYEGTVQAAGAEMDVVLNADFDTETVTGTGISHAVGTVGTTLPIIGDLNIPIESYQQAEDGGITAYTNIYNSKWIKSYEKIEEADKLPSKFDFKLLAGIMQKIASGDIKAELAEETETLGDKEVYRMDVTVTGDLLNELLAAAAEAEGENSEIPADLDLTGADVDFVFFIEKETKLPAKIIFDCAALANVVMQSADEDGLKGTADKLLVTIVFNEYDTVNDLTIPEDVISSAIDEDFDFSDILQGK